MTTTTGIDLKPILCVPLPSTPVGPAGAVSVSTRAGYACHCAAVQSVYTATRAAGIGQNKTSEASRFRIKARRGAQSSSWVAASRRRSSPLSVFHDDFRFTVLPATYLSFTLFVRVVTTVYMCKIV